MESEVPDGRQQDADEEVNPEVIDLVQSRIEDMKEVPKTEAVKYMHLRWNLITKIEDLNVVPNLVHLELYDNQITKIENLESLAKLEVLDISVNRLTKIEGLEKLENLQKLYLCSNKIQKIENVCHLKKLEELELGDNKIRVIENLSGLDNLKKLFLGKNKIDKIKNLDDLKSLELLSLQSNRITKIENLEKLLQLKELHLSENGITEIAGLENLSNLTTLDLASNKLTLIQNVSHLQKLQEFWMDTNKISDWNTVENLGSLKSLSTVYLEHNPISQTPTYRRKVRLILPLLEYLDAIRIRVETAVALKGTRSKSGMSLKGIKSDAPLSKSSWKSNSRLVVVSNVQRRSKATDQRAPKARIDPPMPRKETDAFITETRHKTSGVNLVTVRATTQFDPGNSKSAPKYRIEVEENRQEESKMNQMRKEPGRFRLKPPNSNELARHKLASVNSRTECCIAKNELSKRGDDKIGQTKFSYTGSPIQSLNRSKGSSNLKLEGSDHLSNDHFSYVTRGHSQYLNVLQTRVARKSETKGVKMHNVGEPSRRVDKTRSRLRTMSGSMGKKEAKIKIILEDSKTTRGCQSKPATGHFRNKS